MLNITSVGCALDAIYENDRRRRYGNYHKSEVYTARHRDFLFGEPAKLSMVSGLIGESQRENIMVILTEGKISGKEREKRIA